MKPIPSLALLLVCALSSLGLARHVSAAPSSALTSTASSEAKQVALARDGASDWHIELRSPDERAVAFAAAELATYVEKISGARLPVETEPREGGPRVVIGLRQDLSEADRALLPEPKEGHDGYAVRVASDVDGAPRVVIGADAPRGAVYAVYDLLERLGCRFPHPTLDPDDPEVVPQTDAPALATGAWAVASPMRFRTLAWFEWRVPRNAPTIATTPEELARQIDWAMKARYNVFETPAIEFEPTHPLYRALAPAKQRGMLLQAPGHNFELFLPHDDETFAKHPEWFGMLNGRRRRHQTYGAQFCWSHPEARKRFVDNVEAFVRARPELDVLMLSGIDGGSFAPPCECALCQTRHPSDGAIQLANEVVARLREVAPHVVVETLGGYQYSNKLPKWTWPDPALRVEWAHWGRNLSMAYDNPRYARRERLELWALLFGGRLTAFQYYSDLFATPWPSPAAAQIGGDRTQLMAFGVDGMLNLLFPDGAWWRATLNGYVAGRAFYDATLDPLALLDDYARTYHGPGAGSLMAEYYAEWAAEPELAYRTRDRATRESRAKLAAQRARLIEPAIEAAKSDPTYAYRMRKVERVHRLAEMMMDAEIARHEAIALREAGAVERARARLVRASKRTDRAERFARRLVATSPGLVDPSIDDVFGRWRQGIRREQKLLDAPPESAPQPSSSPESASRPPSQAAAAAR
ncbi:MAG TPA: DUF4838 domain-containing protein [Candidatus Binatia bacterium]